MKGRLFFASDYMGALGALPFASHYMGASPEETSPGVLRDCQLRQKDGLDPPAGQNSIVDKGSQAEIKLLLPLTAHQNKMT